MTVLQIDVWFILDRTVWLLIGVAIGFCLGWIRRERRDVYEMEKRVLKKDDQGASTLRVTVNGVALAVVVALTVYAAFVSASTSQQMQEDNRRDQLQEQADQRRRDAENSCTSQVLFTTVNALNERTENSVGQAQANIKLQVAQANFIKALQNPEKDALEELRRYGEAQSEYIQLVGDTLGRQNQFTYPTPEQYSRCLEEARATE